MRATAPTSGIVTSINVIQRFGPDGEMRTSSYLIRWRPEVYSARIGVPSRSLHEAFKPKLTVCRIVSGRQRSDALHHGSVIRSIYRITAVIHSESGVFFAVPTWGKISEGTDHPMSCVEGA